MSRAWTHSVKNGLSRYHVHARHPPLIHHGKPMEKSLQEKIYHYASFPANGVSLSQMVQFGNYPNDGVLFRASQFVVEELPIRLARRVHDLAQLPHNLSSMPSIRRVSDWYVHSFDELTSIRTPSLDEETKKALYAASKKVKQKVPIMSRPELGIKQEGYDDTSSSSSSSSKKLFSPGGGLSSVSPSGGSTWGRPYFVPVTIEHNHWPIEVEEYNNRVTNMLLKIKARHDGVVSTVAQGVVEWKESEYFVPDEREVQQFLDEFYMSRIGIRMLIGQHISLNMDRGLRDDYVGIICTDTNVKEVAQTAIDNARFICEDWYGLFEAPKVQLHSNAENIKFVYVPGHLNHILFEMIKNSLRAVVESYGVDHESYPPVKVIIAQGDEDITIKISDEGGGVPRANLNQAWSYMYTTAKESPKLEPDASRSDFRAPMAGFGYGLPISRLYARYFGGDLKMISMEGYGTDVYLHLNRLTTGQEPVV